MIEFACKCGKRFSVLDSFACRNVRCKNCGAEVIVPAQRISPSPLQGEGRGEGRSADQPKLPMRTRRLLADADQMSRVFKNSPLIRVASATGTPPDTYQIEYRVKGLQAGGKSPAVREQHL